MIRTIFLLLLLLAVRVTAEGTVKTVGEANSAHFPQSLYYQGNLISPACIIERKSPIINLDKCPDNYEGISRNDYQGNGEVNISEGRIATEQYYTGTVTQHASGALYQMNYLGDINGTDLILVNMIWYNGRGFQVYRPTELLSLVVWGMS